MAKLHPQDLALAAEHQVASILSARGWAAVMMPRGHRDVDLLAYRDGRTLSVQVKGSETALDPADSATAAAKSRPMPVIYRNNTPGVPPPVRADFYVFAFMVGFGPDGAPIWKFVVMTRSEVAASLMNESPSGAYVRERFLRAAEHRGAWQKFDVA
jgi:hypothetical protein